MIFLFFPVWGLALESFWYGRPEGQSSPTLFVAVETVFAPARTVFAAVAKNRKARKATVRFGSVGVGAGSGSAGSGSVAVPLVPVHTRSQFLNRSGGYFGKYPRTPRVKAK